MVLIFSRQCLPSGECSINILIIISCYSEGDIMFVGFHKAMTPSGPSIVKDVGGCREMLRPFAGSIL